MLVKESVNYRFARLIDADSRSRVVGCHSDTMPGYSLNWMQHGNKFEELSRTQILREFGENARILVNDVIVSHQEWLDECN